MSKYIATSHIDVYSAELYAKGYPRIPNDRNVAQKPSCGSTVASWVVVYGWYATASVLAGFLFGSVSLGFFTFGLLGVFQLWVR